MWLTVVLVMVIWTLLVTNYVCYRLLKDRQRYRMQVDDDLQTVINMSRSGDVIECINGNIPIRAGTVYVNKKLSFVRATDGEKIIDVVC